MYIHIYANKAIYIKKKKAFTLSISRLVHWREADSVWGEVQDEEADVIEGPAVVGLARNVTCTMSCGGGYMHVIRGG
jgi:hypothetical protein